LLNDALSPQMQLPNLRLGQTWTVPAFSPLWPTKSPMQILHAKVEYKEPVSWNAAIRHAWVVVYRNDPGAEFGREGRLLGKLWVLEDGTVIKQQAVIFDSKLIFTRLSDEEAKRLALQYAEDD
ncbi:MAG: hypothetical protein ACWGMZ_02670, partial [Thermoguttaceae bacterium]